MSRKNKDRLGLTSEKLKEELHYCSNSGVFTRVKDVPTGRRRKGDTIGSLMGTGYIEVGVLGSRYLGHRLAWLYMTGEWPKKLVDHKNGVRSDNRWENLREANYSQQAANRRPKEGTRSGHRGVFFDPTSKHKPWFSRIEVNGVRHPLGYYRTVGEAKEVYETAFRKHFGEYVRL